MKGLFFQYNNDQFEILSEPMMHPEGDIEIVVKRLSDNLCDIFSVSNIRTLYIDKAQMKD